MSKSYVPVVIIADNENGKSLLLYPDKTYITSSITSNFDYNSLRPFVNFPVFGRGKIGDWTRFEYPTMLGTFSIYDQDEGVFGNVILKNWTECAIGFGYLDTATSSINLLFVGEITNVEYDYMRRIMTVSYIDPISALRSKRWGFPKFGIGLNMGSKPLEEKVPQPREYYDCLGSTYYRATAVLDSDYNRATTNKIMYYDSGSWNDYSYFPAKIWLQRHGIKVYSQEPEKSDHSVETSYVYQAHAIYKYRSETTSYISDFFVRAMAYLTNIRKAGTTSTATGVSSSVFLRVSDWNPYDIFGQTGFFVKYEEWVFSYDSTNRYLGLNFKFDSNFKSKTKTLSTYQVTGKKYISTSPARIRYNGLITRGTMTEDGTDLWKYEDGTTKHLGYVIGFACILGSIDKCLESYYSYCQKYKEASYHSFSETGDSRFPLVQQPFASSFSDYLTEKDFEIRKIIVEFWDGKDLEIGELIGCCGHDWWINKIRYDLYKNIMELEVIREV